MSDSHIVLFTEGFRWTFKKQRVFKRFVIKNRLYNYKL